RALREEPTDVEAAYGVAQAVCINRQRTGKRAPPIAKLVEQFPEDGILATFHGLALAMDEDARAGARELERAPRLGTDPAQVLSAQLVRQIEEKAAPRWYEWLLWGMAAFAGFYAAVMLLMAGFGVVLARWTRGDRALELLGSAPDRLVQEGQV